MKKIYIKRTNIYINLKKKPLLEFNAKLIALGFKELSRIIGCVEFFISSALR